MHRARSRSPTKGWKSPSTSARYRMKSRCGSRCFLAPKDLKFPICNPDCTVSCKGLVSAKIRAGQWKYSTVSKRATQLINKHKCTIKSRSRSPSASSRKSRSKRR